MRTLRPGLYGDDPLTTVRLPQRGLSSQSLGKSIRPLSETQNTCQIRLGGMTQASFSVFIMDKSFFTKVLQNYKDAQENTYLALPRCNTALIQSTPMQNLTHSREIIIPQNCYSDITQPHTAVALTRS